ncbi:XrtB/PEP-CTERM-associated transcriptional regulator EpsA [Duganella qianjiadongensis]|uniref:Helix-turn-helix transcriptional regulator n=1 Tax=Duganella qianjiadongensis TaxID=2692176 RepID=A0ABW9VS29_9BURK|nr:XrtB/PEP-CTERM-associated transcriptional regulator EpsA [Duganella qianjiadongensis]MYM41680.1 helix-turn-helix transcriptional regulator [Duganella qianjiadongensis]
MKRDALVILSKLEQEYLLHAIEAALPVQERRQFFLWSQGPLQALLPHQMMVCMQFGSGDVLQHIDALHSVVLDGDLLRRICHPHDGLAVRLARAARQTQLLPVWNEAGGLAARTPLDGFADELLALGLENFVLHGNGRTAGQDTVFLLFNLPQRPSARHAYFFSLLLPTLHLTLLRLNQRQAQEGRLERPVSAREREILHWVREGKSNDEIGLILGISGLTVKNHLQRLYRLLGVSNRAHAIARGMALQLFEQPPAPLGRAA